MNLDEAVLEEKEGVVSYFVGNATHASEKTIQYIYNLQDDVAVFSETHLDREQTLKMLKLMRQ